MLGVTSTIVQAVFIASLVILVMGFVVKQILVPTYEVYGDVQANILARSLASDISALWPQEEGLITRDLGGLWDISFSTEGGSEAITLCHGEFASKPAGIFAPVGGVFQDLYGVQNISIAKSAGKIEIKRVI